MGAAQDEDLLEGGSQREPRQRGRLTGRLAAVPAALLSRWSRASARRRTSLLAVLAALAGGGWLVAQEVRPLPTAPDAQLFVAAAQMRADGATLVIDLTVVTAGTHSLRVLGVSPDPDGLAFLGFASRPSVLTPDHPSRVLARFRVKACSVARGLSTIQLKVRAPGHRAGTFAVSVQPTSPDLGDNGIPMTDPLAHPTMCLPEPGSVQAAPPGPPLGGGIVVGERWYPGAGAAPVTLPFTPYVARQTPLGLLILRRVSGIDFGGGSPVVLVGRDGRTRVLAKRVVGFAVSADLRSWAWSDAQSRVYASPLSSGSRAVRLAGYTGGPVQFLADGRVLVRLGSGQPGEPSEAIVWSPSRGSVVRVAGWRDGYVTGSAVTSSWTSFISPSGAVCVDLLTFRESVTRRPLCRVAQALYSPSGQVLLAEPTEFAEPLSSTHPQEVDLRDARTLHALSTVNVPWGVDGVRLGFDGDGALFMIGTAFSDAVGTQDYLLRCPISSGQCARVPLTIPRGESVLPVGEGTLDVGNFGLGFGAVAVGQQ